MKKGLGRGLDALFVDNSPKEINDAVTLKIAEIEPNKSQPRKQFDEKAMAELAESISQYGVIQPLLVRPLATGFYQLVAGERRWRASRMAGLSEVPVVIREMTDNEVMALSMVENLQREDLNPVEEAEGYRFLMDTFEMTQEEVSKRVGKSRPVIANAVRLLSLPEEVLGMVKDGHISSGHGKALLAISDRDEIIKLAGDIVKYSLSVRDIEKRSQKKQNKKVPQKQLAMRDSFFEEIELSLSEEMGRQIKVETWNNKDGGQIHIEFFGKEDLAEFAKRIAQTDV